MFRGRAHALTLLLVATLTVGAGSSKPTASTDLAIDVSGPAHGTPGEPVVFTVSVRNDGPNTADEVEVEGVLSGKGHIVSASGVGWDCEKDGSREFECESVAKLLAGRTAADVLVVVDPGTAQVGDATTLTAEVENDDVADTDPSDNRDAATVTYQPASDLAAHVELDARHDGGPVSSGAGALFAGTLENVGTTNAHGAEFEFAIDGGSIRSIDDDGGLTCRMASSTRAVCTTATVAPGVRHDLQFHVTAPQSSSAGELTATAIARSATRDSDPSNNSSTARVAVAGSSSGYASGYIGPDGGTLTTCAGATTAGAPFCATLVVPGSSTSTAAVATSSRSAEADVDYPGGVFTLRHVDDRVPACQVDPQCFDTVGLQLIPAEGYRAASPLDLPPLSVTHFYHRSLFASGQAGEVRVYAQKDDKTIDPTGRLTVECDPARGVLAPCTYGGTRLNSTGAEIDVRFTSEDPFTNGGG